MESSRRILSRIWAAYRRSTPFGQGLSAAGRPVAVRTLVILAVACLVSLFASAGYPQSVAPLDTPLPLDPAVRTGRLPNGLTFFVRRNGRPEHRVILRLAVKAGSIDEDDDQLGLAHVLEHMAFNGSTHFKSGELVSYLESIGARFGPHVNAYTSYDETVFMLDMPTDRDGALARGFEALSDFAGGITLDDGEIDRERGVVIEEWRSRQGAGSRMLTPQMTALYGQSRYVDRLPIGSPEVLKSFPAQRLRDFYRDHYRADRMGLVVVGDIDPAVVEGLVTRYFAGLRAMPPVERTVYPIPDHLDTRYVTVSDPEAQGSSVSIIHKSALEPFHTLGDYRRVLIRALMNQMLGARLAEIARQPEAPFLRASAGTQGLGRTVESLAVSARVNDGTIEKGLAAIAEEIARVRQYGFGAAELERAKRATLAGYERAFNERNTSESGSFAGELLRMFLNDEATPGIEAELQLVRRFLPEIAVGEVSTLARSMLPEGNRVVLATAPEKAGLAAVTEAGLRSALEAGFTATVAPWHDEMAGRVLMAARPVSGSVRARREIPDIGVTVLTLSNGVEVWLKPTDFRNDQVIFSSYARGGTSLASAADYQNASLSTALVGIAGVGGFSPVDLGKLLAGTIASASAYMSSSTHGVSGSSTPRDLETALQLAYLYFTAPNADPEAFVLVKRRLEAGLANQAENPGSVFGERVRAINTLDHYTSRALKLEDIPRLDPTQMLDFYRARFANAADFTFFFVGSFTVDQITPLVTTYLGSLPSRGEATATFGDLHVAFPTAVTRETVSKGREPRSQTVMSFFADTGQDEFEAHRVRAATAVLEMRLRDLLREELGGTYSVGVGYSDILPQAGYGTTSVQFGSAPDRAEDLTKAVLDEIERLKREGPSLADVQAVKEAEKNDLQTSLRENRYWLNSLQTTHLLGRDARRIPLRAERTESLTQDNIHAAIRKYFPMDRYTVVTLMPEAAQ